MRHYTVLYKYGMRARQFWRLFIQLGAMRLISYLTHACGIIVHGSVCSEWRMVKMGSLGQMLKNVWSWTPAEQEIL